MINKIKAEYPLLSTIPAMDDCIVGVCHYPSRSPIVAYSHSKIISSLMSRGMNEHIAQEYFENEIFSNPEVCFIEQF